MDAGKSLLELINTFEMEVYVHGDIVEWISGELTFCLFEAAIIPSYQISPNVISLPPKVTTITS